MNSLLRTGLMKKWPFKIESHLLSNKKSSTNLSLFSNRMVTNYKQRTLLLKKFFDQNKMLYINTRITSTKPRDRLDTIYLAKQFIDTLTTDERKIIKEQLEIINQEEQSRAVASILNLCHFFKLHYLNLFHY